jgi:hypothetical protein
VCGPDLGADRRNHRGGGDNQSSIDAIIETVLTQHRTTADFDSFR